MKILNLTDDAMPAEIEPRAAFNDAINGFESWLSLQDLELDRLFVDECPALLELGFSDGGLVAVVEFLLARLPDRDAATHKPGSDILSRVTRYWGEYLIRNFECEWILTYDEAETPSLSPEPRVLPPYGSPIFNPFRDVLACVLRRSDGLSRMAAYAADDYQAWVSRGRPSPGVTS